MVGVGIVLTADNALQHTTTQRCS